MPLPAYTNGTTSHRRTLSSSKSLAPGNPKTTLSSRVQSQSKLSALGKKRVTEVKFSGITGEDIFIDAAVGSDKGGIEVDIDMTFLQYWSVHITLSPGSEFVTPGSSLNSFALLTLQRWKCSTACDKQILVPNSQALYCSERFVFLPPSPLRMCVCGT